MSVRFGIVKPPQIEHSLEPKGKENLERPAESFATARGINDDRVAGIGERASVLRMCGRLLTRRLRLFYSQEGAATGRCGQL